MVMDEELRNQVEAMIKQYLYTTPHPRIFQKK